MDTVTISDMSALNSRFHVFKYTERIISVGLHHIAASRVELTAYRIKNCDVMLTKENCNVLCWKLSVLSEFYLSATQKNLTCHAA